MKPLVVRIGRDRLRAEVPGRNWAAEAHYASAEDLSAAFSQLVEEMPGSSHRRGVKLLLESPLAQVRRLSDLPAVGAKDLRSLIAMQSGRFFRKNGKPLITDAIWLRQRSGVREALAAAVEAPIVEAVVTASRAAGFAVLSATPAGSAGLTRLSLLPLEARESKNGAARAGLRRLAVVVFAAWLLLAIGYPLWLRTERHRVEARRTALAGAVQALSDLRREVRQAQQMLDSVAGTRRDRGEVLALATRLVGGLPDSVHLTSLLLRSDGSGVVSGRASQSAAVLASLTRGGVIRVPRVEGPILRESIGGREWEGFTIRFGSNRP